MNPQLIKASREQKQVIENLLQFYMYDFSEFIPMDVGDEGLFDPYKYLDEYWIDVTRIPYLLKLDGKPIGFVLVREINSEEGKYFSIAEFFVMRGYRGRGIGSLMAKQVFHLHRGHWEVFQRESNKPAQIFWKKVIDEFTIGAFTEKIEGGKVVQSFKS